MKHCETCKKEETCDFPEDFRELTWRRYGNCRWREGAKNKSIVEIAAGD